MKKINIEDLPKKGNIYSFESVEPNQLVIITAIVELIGKDIKKQQEEIVNRAIELNCILEWWIIDDLKRNTEMRYTPIPPERITDTNIQQMAAELFKSIAQS